MAQNVQTPFGEEEVLTPEELQLQTAERQRREDEKYPIDAEGTRYCRQCGTAVAAVAVAHPIWDGPFAQAGSGLCAYQKVVYCPQCEQPPSPHGSPVAPLGSHHNPHPDGTMTYHSKVLDQTFVMRRPGTPADN